MHHRLVVRWRVVIQREIESDICDGSSTLSRGKASVLFCLGQWSRSPDPWALLVIRFDPLRTLVLKKRADIFKNNFCFILGCEGLRLRLTS